LLLAKAIFSSVTVLVISTTCCACFKRKPSLKFKSLKAAMGLVVVLG